MYVSVYQRVANLQTYRLIMRPWKVLIHITYIHSAKHAQGCTGNMEQMCQILFIFQNCITYLIELLFGKKDFVPISGKERLKLFGDFFT